MTDWGPPHLLGVRDRLAAGRSREGADEPENGAGCGPATLSALLRKPSGPGAGTSFESEDPRIL